jgi:hypothetical protein
MLQAKISRRRGDSATSPLLAGGLLKRKCACGRHTAAGGQCAKCQKQKFMASQSEPSTVGASVHTLRPFRLTHPKSILELATRRNVSDCDDRSAVAARPTKSLSPAVEHRDEEKPSPAQGGATIQCDGSGGYEIVYNGWAGATCGTLACVTAHEASHMGDWRSKWPTGCRGQARGYLPRGDPPDSPTMTTSEYSSFLKQSECKAHTVDLNCARALPRAAGCDATIDGYIKLTEDQKSNFCPGLGAIIGLGLAGALAGAGIGALIGGPVGALIGGGLGALGGAIVGASL